MRVKITTHIYPTSRRLCITNLTNSSRATYESLYNVDPGSDTLAIDIGCLSGPSPSTPSRADDFNEPFVYGRVYPLLLATVPLCPLVVPAMDDGPASGMEEKDVVES